MDHSKCEKRAQTFIKELNKKTRLANETSFGPFYDSNFKEKYREEHREFLISFNGMYCKALAFSVKILITYLDAECPRHTGKETCYSTTACLYLQQLEEIFSDSRGMEKRLRDWLKQCQKEG